MRGRRKWSLLLGVAVVGAALPARALDPVPETERGDGSHYIVRPDDTVWRIARRHGVTVEDLKRANGIDDVRRLLVGRELHIPPPRETPRDPHPPRPASPKGAQRGEAERSPERASPKGAQRGEAERSQQAWTRVDDSIAEGARHLADARFDDALEAVHRARAAFPEGARAAESAQRVARAELIAATAHVALGHHDAARRCLTRTLVADPDLRLDPATTSPKVMRLFYLARAEAQPAAPGAR